MPFDKKHDLIEVRKTWEAWAKGERPDLLNMQALAIELDIPVSYLYKKTGKWRKDLKAKLEADLGQMRGSTPSRAKREDQREIGSEGRGRLNADRPLSSSSLSYTDEFRRARQLGKDALSVAMQGLIDEATTGTGASRVSAIRELLDRAGLAKDKERKDEPSPYEEEDSLVLKDRLIALVGSNTMITSLLTNQALKGQGPGETNPTTSQEATTTNLITPSPTGSQVSVEVTEPLEPACVEVVPGPSVMLT